MKPNELDALIKLIDDPDDSVFFHVKDKLLTLGEDVIPVLENAWEGNSFGVVFQSRIEDIIHTIQFDNVSGMLKNWKEKGGVSLLDGALLINRYQYPDLNEDKLKATIKQIEQDVWIELNDNLTALEKIRVLNHIFFEVHGLSGNKTSYHAPQNSYLNNVLETKKGNPLSLSVLYITIANSVGLPVFGVNLPSHFILVYVDKPTVQEVDISKEQLILFYINTFSKGAVLSKREVDHFLKQLKLETQPMFYQPCSNLSIIKRMLNNLIYSYQKLGYLDKVEELESLLKVFAED